MLTRLMSKKSTDTEIAVAETSSKQTKKKEMTNKAKSGTTKTIDVKNGEGARKMDDSFIEDFGEVAENGCTLTYVTIMDDAFCLYMSQTYLKGYWEKNPDKRVVTWDANKAGYEKWCSLSDDERAHYVKLVEGKNAELRRRLKDPEAY